MKKGASVSFRDQFKLITNGRLLLVFIITALGYGGTFVTFTYLSPLLQVTGFKANTVTIILLVYGIAIAIGNVIGGNYRIIIRFERYFTCSLFKRLYYLF